MAGVGGDDTLTGGAGADSFYFTALNLQPGDATVADFALSEDRLIVGWVGLPDWALNPERFLSHLATVQGGNTVLDFGKASITLIGVTDLGALADDLVLQNQIIPF
jgi:serralysin